MEGLFIAIGHKPNTGVFQDWLEVDEKGYLVAHDHTVSRIPGVFIAGDVQDHRYRQAVTAAGDGARAAIDAERWLEAEGIAQHQATTARQPDAGPTRELPRRRREGARARLRRGRTWAGPPDTAIG